MEASGRTQERGEQAVKAALRTPTQGHLQEKHPYAQQRKAEAEENMRLMRFRPVPMWRGATLAKGPSAQAKQSWLELAWAASCWLKLGAGLAGPLSQHDVSLSCWMGTPRQKNPQWCNCCLQQAWRSMKTKAQAFGKTRGWMCLATALCSRLLPPIGWSR